MGCHQFIRLGRDNGEGFNRLTVFRVIHCSIGRESEKLFILERNEVGCFIFPPVALPFIEPISGIRQRLRLKAER